MFLFDENSNFLLSSLLRLSARSADVVDDDNDDNDVNKEDQK